MDQIFDIFKSAVLCCPRQASARGSRGSHSR